MIEIPVVSVVMNCFNGERFLREALDSVLHQTVSNWELVFWDNRSTDRSAAIVQEYSDSRLRYFLADRHTALGEARNLAVAKTSGQWLAFLDCDDIWLPRKLELQLGVLESGSAPPGFVYCRTEFYRRTQSGKWKPSGEAPRKLNRGGALPERDVFEKLLDFDFINWSSVMVRRDAYERVGGINPKCRQGEDYDLLLKLAQVEPVRSVSECCCYYRIHEHNATWTQIESRYLETIQSLRDLKRSVPVERALDRHFARYFLHILLRERRLKKAMSLFGKFSLFDLVGLVISKIRLAGRRLFP